MSAERPDFVMAGGQSDGRFYLLASKSLTEVELRFERDRIETGYGLPKAWGRERHFVTAEMRDYVMVVGDSYAQCFTDLFAEWDPTPDRPSIAGQAALPAASRMLDERRTDGPIIGW